jgi:DNA-binding NarL/FixJ family response regulator
MAKITLVVVDDHPLFRQGVVDAISLDPEFSVVGLAVDGEEAMRLIRELSPGIAVVDVNLPKLNGQQVLRQVMAEKLSTRIILLTAYDDPEQRTHALRGGAAAYCSKDVEPERLIQVIHNVADGKFVVGDQLLSRSGLEHWLTEQTGSAMRSYGDPGEPFSPLSEREMEVLTYVTRGLSNKDIGVLLGISHQTVKNHVTSILRKLCVEDRTQAALYALRRGWVRLYKQNSQHQE